MVVVGYGRVGTYTVNVLERLDVPILVVEQDMQRAVEFQKRGSTDVGGRRGKFRNSHPRQPRYGTFARGNHSDENAAELVVAAAREMAPDLRIIARAATTEGVHTLAKLGANDVIHPELEGGLEIVRHALLALGFPMVQVQQYIDTVRKDSYDTTYTGLEEVHLLDQLVATVRGVEIAWRAVEADSPWPAARWPRQTSAHIPAPPSLRWCAITRCRPTRSQVQCSRPATWSA